MNDKNKNYYFLSHDGKKEKLRRTAIKWDEIKETIVNLPLKVILLADTYDNGEQKPTTILPQSIPDFALGMK